MKGKSAKDLAFDRERAKHRKEVSDLKDALLSKDLEIRRQRNQIIELEDERDTLKDWVSRLLEYAELSEEDMKKLIKKDLDSAEIMERMKPIFGMLGKTFI